VSGVEQSPNCPSPGLGAVSHYSRPLQNAQVYGSGRCTPTTPYGGGRDGAAFPHYSPWCSPQEHAHAMCLHVSPGLRATILTAWPGRRASSRTLYCKRQLARKEHCARRPYGRSRAARFSRPWAYRTLPDCASQVPIARRPLSYLAGKGGACVATLKLWFVLTGSSAGRLGREFMQQPRPTRLNVDPAPVTRLQTCSCCRPTPVGTKPTPRGRRSRFLPILGTGSRRSSRDLAICAVHPQRFLERG
jgi:hypothetical protein